MAGSVQSSMKSRVSCCPSEVDLGKFPRAVGGPDGVDAGTRKAKNDEGAGSGPRARVRDRKSG